MICVSIGSVSAKGCIEAVKKHELCELRLDKLNLTEQDIKTIFSLNKNLIASYRDCNSAQKRIPLLEKAMASGAKYVDIDVQWLAPVIKKVRSYAKKKKTKVIASYHNYKKTPSLADLKKILSSCAKLDPAIIKIACKSSGDKDNARLLGLLDSDVKMIVVGMGPKGSLTRLVAPKLGAFCTFASLYEETKTAPGQFSVQEMEKLLNGLYYV